MTNTIAAAIAGSAAALLALDLVAGWGGAMFLARRFVLLLEWLAFWR